MKSGSLFGNDIRLEDIKGAYEKIKRRALLALEAGETERSIQELECAARTAYQFNFIYADSEAEEILRGISKKLFPTVSTFVPRTDRYVFYDSFGKENRNLTQQYIRALMQLGYEFLYVFERKDPRYSQTIESDLEGYSKAEIFELDSSLPSSEQACQLYQRLVEYAPSKALLQLLPWAVVALAVFYALPQVTKYNINLTDHAFWLGNECLDYNLEFRDYGCTVSLEKRKLKEEQLLLLPYYPVINRKRFEGFPKEVTPDKVLIFSGGAFYKIYGEKGIYFDLVARLLEENPSSVLLYAGDGDRKPMERFIRKHHFEHRVFLLGNRRDINEVFAAADIYLGTYPFTGGLMSQYAAVNGKPILAYSSLEFATNFVEGIVCHNKPLQITHTDLELFFAYGRCLCEDAEFRKAEGEKLRRCVISPEEFAVELRDVLQKNVSSRVWKPEKIDYEKFHGLYVEVENRFQYTWKLMLLRKYKLRMLTYFPRLFVMLLPRLVHACFRRSLAFCKKMEKFVKRSLFFMGSWGLRLLS